MRTQLENSLYQHIKITGIIDRFGTMRFDGHDTIQKSNPHTGIINPIRFIDTDVIEPIYFDGKSTLIKNARLNNELIGDGHMWIPQDLSQKGFHINEEICVDGTAEYYKRHDGSYDFTIKSMRITSL